MRRLVFLLALLFVTPVLAQTVDDVNATIDQEIGDHSLFETAFADLQGAVADGNAAAVAQYVDFTTPITVVMLHVNWLIGGIVVTEAIFGYPGLGLLMLTAANQKDVPLLEGGAIVFGIVAVCSQLAADILGQWLNPQARTGSK